MGKLKIVFLFIALCGFQLSKAGCGKPKPYIEVSSLGNLEFQFFCNAWNIKWLLGNGATLIGNGNYTYPKEGRFLIRVVVTDSLKSCSDTFVWDSLCVIGRNAQYTKTGQFKYELNPMVSDTSKRNIYWDFCSLDYLSF